MTTTTADVVKIGITCPDCGKKTDKTLTWLQASKDMSCGHCGTSIDLTVGNNRAVIEEIGNVCAQLDGRDAMQPR